MTSENLAKEPVKLSRWLAIGGMVGTILFIPIAFLIGETRDGYSHFSQGISALSETGAPAAWAQSANFITLGVLTIGLAAGLHRGISHGKGSIVGPALIGVFGLLALSMNGIFPADPVGAPETTVGTIHSLTAGLGFLAVIASMFILPRRFREDKDWTNLAGISRWMGTGTCILMVTYLFAQEGVVGTLEPWTGLLQRIFVATVLLWLFLLALRLFQTSWLRAKAARSPR
jgi:hypothetical membrane protein